MPQHLFFLAFMNYSFLFRYVFGIWQFFANFKNLRTSVKLCCWCSSLGGRWSCIFLFQMQVPKNEGRSKPERREICIKVRNNFILINGGKFQFQIQILSVYWIEAQMFHVLEKISIFVAYLYRI